MKQRLLLLLMLGVLVFFMIVLVNKLSPTAFPLQRKDEDKAIFKVKVLKEYIQINMPYNLIIKITKEEEKIAGITEVRSANNSVIFRNPSTPISFSFGIKNKVGKFQKVSFTDWEYKGYKQDKDKFTLQTSIKINGSVAFLDIVFIPKTLEVDSSIYEGFGYHYNLRSRNTKIHMIADKATWELGGDITNNSVIRPTEYIGKLKEDEFFTNQWFDVERQQDFEPHAARFGDLQCQLFDYQKNEDGVLITYYESPFYYDGGKRKPVLIRTHAYKYSKQDLYHSNDCTRFHIDDYIYFGLTNRITTPTKFVLFSRDKGSDAWAMLKDCLYNYYRAQYGLKEEIHLPTCCIPLVNNDGTYNTLEKIADSDLLEKIKEAGFKRIFIWAEIWMDVIQEKGPWFDISKLEIDPRIGNDKDFKRLCDKAHELGLKLIVWVPVAHLSVESPLLENPGFHAAINPNGSPCQRGYSDLVAMNLKDKKYMDYLKGRYHHFRKLGLDGLVLDSYSYLGYGVIDYSKTNPEWIPQTEELLSLQQELQELGYIQLIEGLGPFGLHSMQFHSDNFSQWANHVEYFYKFAPFITGTVPIAAPDRNAQQFVWPYENPVINTHFMDDYFKFLANASPISFNPFILTDQNKLMSLLGGLLSHLVERELSASIREIEINLIENRKANIQKNTSGNKIKIKSKINIEKSIESFFRPLSMDIGELQKEKIKVLEKALNYALEKSIHRLKNFIDEIVQNEADVYKTAVRNDIDKKTDEEIKKILEEISKKPSGEFSPLNVMIGTLINPAINPLAINLLIANLEDQGIITVSEENKIGIGSKIKNLNKAYNAVANLMEIRHLLKDKKGVLWTNSDNSEKVLFTYQNIPYEEIKDCIYDFDKQRLKKFKEEKWVNLTKGDLIKEGIIAHNIYLIR